MRWIRHEKRLAIYARDAFRCVYCEAVADAGGLALDHVDPCSGNEPDNLVTVCNPCNNAKSYLALESWLRRRARAGEPREALAIIRQRVALATFLPIDIAIGKRLEGRRGRGPGSFAALATFFDSLRTEETDHAA